MKMNEAAYIKLSPFRGVLEEWKKNDKTKAC